MVELLRPDSWVAEQGAAAGRTIELSIPECGIDGEAVVLAVRPCPELQPTPEDYRTVTGTFRHASAKILNIHVEDLDTSIGTTAAHPFWSEDRGDYVPAGELRVGEHLLGESGRFAITSISPRGPPEPVFNLEVLGDHNFHVTAANLLVHNGCPVAPKGAPGLDDLSKLGQIPDKGGLTAAGRSLAKHASGKRPGSAGFPSVKGNPSQISRQAQDVLDDILTDPAAISKIRPGKAGEQLLQVHKPDGTGVIFKLKDGDWIFSHFAENLL